MNGERADRIAAVDAERRAGDIAGRIAGEIKQRMADILARRRAAERDLGERVLDVVGRQLADRAAGREAGLKRVRPDAIFGKLDRKSLGEAVERGLRGAIGYG